MSGDGAGGPVEQFAGFQHRVHDDGELARHGDGGALEADPLPQLQPPGAQVALGRAAGQDDRGRFVEQTSQLVVAAPGDMAVIVDLARTGSAASSGRARRRRIATF